VALLCAVVNVRCDKAVCFNSFYGECGRDNDDSEKCTFNERNSYDMSYPGNNGGHKLIFASTLYELSWIGDRLDDYPVRLAWHAIDSKRASNRIAGADRFSDMKWDTSKLYRRFRLQGDEHAYKADTSYGIDITEKGRNSRIFDFNRLVESGFPNNHTDMTGIQALFYAGAFYSLFSISQPENPDYSEDDVYWSDTFYITSSPSREFLQAENDRGHAEEKQKWRLGVGVGVGVGVPVLLALLIWQMCRMRQKSKGIRMTSRKVTES
jgi:hypothetical protein